MSASRFPFFSLFCLVFVAELGLSGGAFASPRPADAPREVTARPVPSPPVEYETRKGESITITFHPSVRERARHLSDQADALWIHVNEPLGGARGGPVEVRVGALRAELGRLVPEGTPSPRPGMAWTRERLVVLCADDEGPLVDLEASLAHGLAHIALDDALAGHDVPRWFHEGFAVQMAGEGAVERAGALSLAALRGALLTPSELELYSGENLDETPLALAQSADFVGFLRRQGQDELADLARAMRDQKPFEAALQEAFAEDPGSLARAHRADVSRRFGFLPVLGTSGALLAVGLGIAVLRRMRRPQNAEKDAEDADRAMRAPRSAKRNRMIVVGSRVIHEERELARILPPEPDVPKVEHDGEWHTLH